MPETAKLRGYKVKNNKREKCKIKEKQVCVCV